ncbi:MAG: GntR family transcriptional regulator [Gemmataceae bacterium]
MSESGLPKYQQVADELEQRVRDGEWDAGKMPSVRWVAQEYKTSIVTSSRAMQVLRDKGLIQSVERTGSFRMAPPTAERWGVVIRVTPGPYQSSITQMVRHGFEVYARREPMHLHFDLFDFDTILTPEDAREAAKNARGSGIRGVFLLPSRVSPASAETDRLFLDGCQAEGLPVVLLERGLRQADPTELTHDLVTMDDLQAGISVTQHLHDLARQRIGMIVGSPTSSHNNRLAGYLLALNSQRQSRREFPEFIYRTQEGFPSKEDWGDLVDRIVKDRIDGIICYHDYIAIGLLYELLNRGLRVPEDIAICGFENIDVGSMIRGGLTTTDYPADVLATHAIAMIRLRLAEPNRPPVRVVIPNKLIIRGSTIGSE